MTKAMVMAAGLGLRMRPLTEHCPKPLITVAGRPLIDHILDWLAAAGISETVINGHHLAGMLKAHLATRAHLRSAFSYEEERLETGGGIKKALPLLGNAPFFAINGDVICLDGKTPALHRLQDMWDPQIMDALLLVHPVERAVGYHGKGDFFVDNDGLLRRRGKEAAAPFVFTGIQMLKPELFRSQSEKAFSLNIIYDQLLQQNPKRIRALVHDGDWLHIGDPQGLQQAEAFLARH